MMLQPHDLVRVDGARWVEPEDASSQAAIEACLRLAPWVVVRRALRKDGWLPVGIRGSHRGERHAAWLDPKGAPDVIKDRMKDVRKPESLRASGHMRDLPALAALQVCEHRFRWLDRPWGPIGSMGFELASGIPTVTGTSDLDLLMRLIRRPTGRELTAIANCCNDLPCAVDLQIATPYGTFALQEYRAGGSEILLRTCAGPVLVNDPWKPLEVPCDLERMAV